ncbi:hypothetical protein TeGR_g5471 [Tetraparma gracilis]|uniref:TLC domain-containing protein n=1 Tax=Tetraparma gracilis TaxID=2962635 RepID=A0ABQ6M701_9STRA|nr:hypothetical protein TeGR_g5471 [Tetraparma gracilis]
MLAVISTQMQALASSSNILIASFLPDIESNHQTQATVAGAFFFIFTAMYVMEALLQPSLDTRAKRHNWCVRIPSQYHAALVSLFGWIAFFDVSLWEDPVTSSSPSAVFGSCIIIGYMAADLISVFVNFEDEGFTFLFHAIATLCPYCMSLYTGNFITYTTSAMIAETSTLWLNARFLCIISKRASNALFELVQLQFFLVFIFVRIVVAMGFLLPWWLKLAGGAYVKGVPNAPFELAELASGDFANFAKTDAPGWWWVFLTFNIVAMCCLNSMWAVGMVKIALGLGGGGDKKKGSKKKTKEDTFTGMNITPFNLLVYVPLMIIPQEKGVGKESSKKKR